MVTFASGRSRSLARRAAAERAAVGGRGPVAAFARDAGDVEAGGAVLGDRRGGGGAVAGAHACGDDGADGELGALAGRAALRSGQSRGDTEGVAQAAGAMAARAVVRNVGIAAACDAADPVGAID